mmetsp:Transcript_6916/g.14402  ORF Transcript_6916/g.14402 Transcript_6916/m.14402 type:complete len:346 (-) Transcript_6916:68-1105(-)
MASLAVPDDFWLQLSSSVRKRYTKLAGLDPMKPGQKARVLILMVDAIGHDGGGGIHSAAAEKLVWADFSNEAVARQVKDFAELMKSGAVVAVEYNLVARAGLLIDLQLIPPAMYELAQSKSSLTSAALICGRFPKETRCGCTIPCQKALREVFLSEIRPGFYIGPVQAAYLDDELRARGVTHVLNLSGTRYHERDSITYCCVDFADTPDADLRGVLPACLRFIARSLGSAAGSGESSSDASDANGGCGKGGGSSLTSSVSGVGGGSSTSSMKSSSGRGRGGGGVLVHCLAGKSRSASVCAAWLIVSEGLTAAEAIAAVQSAHPRADPNRGFRDALRRFEDKQQRQ